MENTEDKVATVQVQNVYLMLLVMFFTVSLLLSYQVNDAVEVQKPRTSKVRLYAIASKFSVYSTLPHAVVIAK